MTYSIAFTAGLNLHTCLVRSDNTAKAIRKAQKLLLKKFPHSVITINVEKILELK